MEGCGASPNAQAPVADEMPPRLRDVPGDVLDEVFEPEAKLLLELPRSVDS